MTTRSLTPAAYGVAAVQFHLLNTTILFLSREGFRRGCLRVDAADPRATAKVLGTSMLSIPIGAALSLLISGGFLLTLPSDDPWMKQAVAMQGAAALIELLSEPLYILATFRLWFAMRVACEAASTIAKTVATLAFLRNGTSPAIAFSWGQLAYATCLLVTYGAAFWLRQTGDKEHPAKGAQHQPTVQIDRAILPVCGSFALQAGGKLLLAEGSKAALAFATPLHEQGVYGLVNNLGSLVVRAVFQPYEEVAFVAFSRPVKGSTAAQLGERAALLQTLCRGICLLGGLAAAFGPAFSHLALLLLYGRRWVESGAPAALGLYSLYIALLAMNGILEAFVHAVADERQLRHVNGALVALSLMHIALSVAAVTTSGALGLLGADAVNMALRIGYCLWFLGAFFRPIGGMGLQQLLPGPSTLSSLGTSLAATLASQLVFMPEGSAIANLVVDLWPGCPLVGLASSVGFRSGMCAGAHVGVGAVCLAGVIATAAMSERDVLSRLKRLKSTPAAREKKEK